MKIRLEERPQNGLQNRPPVLLRALYARPPIAQE